MSIIVYSREVGPICYEVPLWERSEKIPSELLSSGLVWHWGSALNEASADNFKDLNLPSERALTLLTSDNAGVLRWDFKERDLDGCGRYIHLIGADRDQSEHLLEIGGLRRDLESFINKERGPIRLVIIQHGDCPTALVFVSHNPTALATELLETWGVIPSAVTKTYPYKMLNLAKLESMWKSLLG